MYGRGAKKLQKTFKFSRRQRGRVVSAPDLKSGGREFKSCSDYVPTVVVLGIERRSLSTFLEPLAYSTLRSRESASRPFTIVCSVAWPLNGSEPGVDLTAFVV